MIHPLIGQPPSRAGLAVDCHGSPAKPSMEIVGGCILFADKAVAASVQTCSFADTDRRSQCSTVGLKIYTAAQHVDRTVVTVPNADRLPHMQLVNWGMSDDLTVMGIQPTIGGGSDGARADCSRASGGAPACGQPGCRDRPEAEPRPCGSPRPPRAMPPGRLRSRLPVIGTNSMLYRRTCFSVLAKSSMSLERASRSPRRHFMSGAIKV